MPYCLQKGTDRRDGGSETEKCLTPCRGTQVSTLGGGGGMGRESY